MIKQKRFSYKETLDQQMQKKDELKITHLMNNEEMALNKADLRAYVNGDYYLTSKIPGISGQPQK